MNIVERHLMSIPSKYDQIVLIDGTFVTISRTRSLTKKGIRSIFEGEHELIMKGWNTLEIVYLPKSVSFAVLSAELPMSRRASRMVSDVGLLLLNYSPMDSDTSNSFSISIFFNSNSFFL